MLSDTQRERLAARLRQGRTAAAPEAIGRRTGDGPAPASFGQEQLWFIDRFAPGLTSYNIACGLRLTGPLDVAALGRAVTGLTERHPALRTRLVAGRTGAPVQAVDPVGVIDLPVTDLSAEPAALTRLAGRLAAQPFDLGTGRLFRPALARLSPVEHVLLAVVHHAVFDGWSFGLLMHELPALYEQELTGTPAGLPELAIDYGDYAAWERQQLTGAGLDRQLEYWRGQLAGLPTVEFPTDHPRPPLESHRGAVARLDLPAEVIDRLRALAASQNTTLFVILLSTWAALVSRYTGQDDLVVGTPSANRGRPELAGLVGFLVNTLVIRVDVSQDPPFTDLIGRVRDTTTAAYAHQELPFAKLVQALPVERDASRTPLFQHLFSHAETTPATIHRAGLAVDAFSDFPDPGTAKFDLSFFVGTGDRSEAVLQYAIDLFEPGTAHRILRHYAELLAAVAADPARPISELPLLTEAELYDELIAWNDTAVDWPEATIGELFTARVAESPDAVAVISPDGDTLSYGELAARAAGVTDWLVAQGVGPEQFVGVAMAPSADRIAVVLGILAAGAAYVPLDPALPPARLAFMAADAGLALTVADPEDAVRLADVVGKVRPRPEPRSPVAVDPIEFSPSLPAYLIYTSGSTGQPKGVLVEHRQVTNFARWVGREFELGPGERVLQFASLNFDVSVLDLFGALLAGAAAVVADHGSRQSPARLAELIRRHQVSVAALPPALLPLLVDEDLPTLHTLISAGEELPAEQAQRWQRPGLTLVNGYGPTETTVLAAFARIDGTERPPPIGRPPANYRNYVLDRRLNPVPVGVVGQLYLGGAGVARGYLNRPELTAQRFLDDPFVDGGRMYASGDLVRRRPDGQLVFVGRADGQVKLRGLRVELGEVEQAMLKVAGVQQAVAVLRDEPARLVGYYRGDAEPGQVQAGLSRWLPAYMVPTALVPVAEFPLNSSGKVDRRALPVPGRTTAEDFQHPATPTEQRLTELYAQVLGTDRPVSVTAGFFEAGGNSLQAMQLVAAIRSELGVDLGVNEVFLAPSPRQLAPRLGPERVSARVDSVVVPLSDGPADRPLVFVHAVGGTVFPYARLATELADRYRVFGLQSPLLVQQPIDATDLPGLAARYGRELRAAQPAGPYRLAGWSMGALLAFELTRHLEQLGEVVELLVLLDAPFALPAETVLPDRLASEFAADALRSVGRDVPPPTDQSDPLAGLVEQLGDEPRLRAEVARRFDAFTRHRRLMSGYRPTGTVRARTLVLGGEHSANAAAQAEWARLLPAAERHSFDADHYSLLRAEHLPALAQLVEKAQIDADAAS